MTRWRGIIALAMLVATWGLLQAFSYTEPVLAKRPFSELPLDLAKRWSGKELGLEPAIVDILKVTDYLMRAYIPTAQDRDNARLETLPVWLYIGYYNSQRTGATYHSPKNCLPGAGWQFVEAEQVQVPLKDGPAITINKVLIEKRLDKQLVLYWYQDRGRVIASEYWAKGYMIWDAVTRHRTDGALVRLSVPVLTTAEAAYQHGVSFLQDFWPVLQGYMPEERRSA